MSEDNYMVEIIRSTLDEYTNRVRNEEAGASEFIDNLVSAAGGKVANIATFKELGPGQVPAKPSFVKLGELPADKPAVWTGVVVIAGRNTAVQMFR